MSNTPPPLVSVVIPCYRQGRYLAETVKAVLGQSHPAIEIVVVNDGSDDDTDAVAKSFGDRIVYVSQLNGGHSSARNAGIRRATGDYLYFLDADDSLHRDAIASLVDAAESGGRCIATMGYEMFETPGIWLRGEDAPPAGSLFPWVLVRNYPLHCYLVPRAFAIAIGGFDRAMVSHEDHDFWLRVAGLAPAMRPVALRGAYYRTHGNSESKNRRRMAIGRLQLLENATAAVARDPSTAAKHGRVLLRHLYVSRLIFAATTPELDRTELDRCIVRLHRAGVRSKVWMLDWCYALVPKPLLELADRAILSALRTIAPKKHSDLRDGRINPANRPPASCKSS